jgi:hypothetical protein
MVFNHNENYGNMFKNENKELETNADYTGTINVGGTLYFIDGWLREGAKGKYLSIRVKQKDKQPTDTEL